MALPNKAPSQDAYDVAKNLWYSLPVRKRSGRGITKKLTERGYEVSKTSIGRWSKDWTPDKAPVADATQKLLPPPKGKIPVTFEDIPDDLRDALSPRLLALATGHGLDRAENAVVLLADAIASKSPEIAAMLLTAEAEAAKSVVTAVATMAETLHVIARSKAITAMNHRNFAEGDLYLAQSERARAEARMFDADAEAKLGSARAHNAKEISGEFTEITPDDAQDALDALNGQVRKPAAAAKK